MYLSEQRTLGIITTNWWCDAFLEETEQIDNDNVFWQEAAWLNIEVSRS